MTPARKEALARIKRGEYDHYVQLVGKPTFMSGNGHARYAKYAEWCRARRFPTAPIEVWAAVSDTIQEK